METAKNRSIWLDYLRSFVTALVVAHHAALAYPTFAHFDPSHYIYSTAPIVDDRRWPGMDILIGFNDLFFMPLMFFISGLFVYRGLSRKGAKAYLADRCVRLGIPFLIAEILLIPLAYIPSFYLATQSTDVVLFVNDYLIRQQWPVGPPWFIWLLLAFDGLAVLIFSIQPALFSLAGNGFSELTRRPLRFGAVLYGLVALSLIPISLWVGQYTWVGNWGPFDFQLNRVLVYALFFFTGICLGTTDWQNDLFRHGKLFGKSWPFWLGLSLASYGLVLVVSNFGANQVKQGTLTPTEGYFLYDLAFVASCLASISACLSFFKQTIAKPLRGWDSLSANAYGIYIVHYGFVTWLQFALLNLNCSVFLKFMLVFTGALSLSWLTSHFLRRNAQIAHLL